MPDWLVCALGAVGFLIFYLEQRGEPGREISLIGIAGLVLFIVMLFIEGARISDRTGIFCSNTGSGLSTCRQVQR
jgi:hypothetical protein